MKQNNKFNEEPEIIKKEPKRNSRAEEYKEWSDKCNRKRQQQTQAEERICDCEDWWFKVIQSGGKKGKRMKRSEESLQDLRDTTVWMNYIRTMGVQEEKNQQTFS